MWGIKGSSFRLMISLPTVTEQVMGLWTEPPIVKQPELEQNSGCRTLDIVNIFHIYFTVNILYLFLHFGHWQNKHHLTTLIRFCLFLSRATLPLFLWFIKNSRETFSSYIKEKQLALEDMGCIVDNFSAEMIRSSPVKLDFKNSERSTTSWISRLKTDWICRTAQTCMKETGSLVWSIWTLSDSS